MGKEKKPKALRIAGYIADGVLWNNNILGVPDLIKNIKKGEAAAAEANKGTE